MQYDFQGSHLLSLSVDVFFFTSLCVVYLLQALQSDYYRDEWGKKKKGFTIARPNGLFIYFHSNEVHDITIVTRVFGTWEEAAWWQVPQGMNGIYKIGGKNYSAFVALTMLTEIKHLRQKNPNCYKL